MQEGRPLRIEFANKAERSDVGDAMAVLFILGKVMPGLGTDGKEISGTAPQLDEFSAVVTSSVVHALIAGMLGPRDGG